MGDDVRSHLVVATRREEVGGPRGSKAIDPSEVFAQRVNCGVDGIRVDWVSVTQYTEPRPDSGRAYVVVLQHVVQVVGA